MYKTLQRLSKLPTSLSYYTNSRTFLSQAYYCQEVWDNRLRNPLFEKVNLDELYRDLDLRFQKTRQMSAVDVDIFTNAVKDNLYVDEMLDLVHKLRLTAETGNTLNSTPHAVIRAMIQYGDKKELLNVLDDRINYGVFLDYYTANLLMDIFWKEKDFTSGARVASQLMLQEEFDHPLSVDLSFLHCFNYLKKPGDWPIPQPPEEPEEEIKIRVKYLRNPFDDEHFDLKEPQKIVGKTLAMFTENKNDSLSKSFNILGWILFDKKDKALKSIEDSISKNITLYKEIIDLIPEGSELQEKLNKLSLEPADVQKVLVENIEKSLQKCYEKDIVDHCKLLSAWNDERVMALEQQKQRLSIAKRLSHVEQLKKELEEKETKLWFFDNEEKIELQIEQIEEEEKLQQMMTTTKKKSKKTDDEDYIPPEVGAKPANIA